MKCELCKKNQASFYYYVPILQRQAPICVACLTKFTQNLKSGIVTFDKAMPDLEEFDGDNSRSAKYGIVVCTNCGFEFDDYFETGRFGCVKCYDVFHKRIEPIVKEIHGSVRHNGSRPAQPKAGA